MTPHDPHTRVSEQGTTDNGQRTTDNGLEDKIGYEDVLAAAERIAPWVHRTPVMTSRTLDARCGGNVFLKCEASQDGMVRGRRNAMLDDSDVHWHRQIKSAVGGVTASVTGDPAVFVSVSAAHQGPDGGGPVAAIVDLG